MSLLDDIQDEYDMMCRVGRCTRLESEVRMPESKHAEDEAEIAAEFRPTYLWQRSTAEKFAFLDRFITMRAKQLNVPYFAIESIVRATMDILIEMTLADRRTIEDVQLLVKARADALAAEYIMQSQEHVPAHG